MTKHAQAVAALKHKLNTLTPIEFDALWEALNQFIDNENELEGCKEFRPRTVEAAQGILTRFDAVVCSLAESEL